jgi:hypothetical protein
MKRLLVSILVPAFMLAGVVASPALAAEAEKGKTVTKVLAENDKVRVTESTSKPGDVGPSIVRGHRVVRWLKGGTVMRTYADGKTEKIERKTGEVAVGTPEKQAWSLKNVGKTTIVTYVVTIKEAKK